MLAGITFRQIEAFYWIARSGSFSEAARGLNATQPGISNRIRELETLLKVRLFVAAPSAGEERQEFTISAAAAEGQEKGDVDDVVFERPAGGQ